MARQIHDSLYSGDSLTATIPIVDGDGEAVDLTGATATYCIAATPAAVALVTKTQTDGLALSGSTVTLTLAPADTAALSGVYYHELEIVDSAGNVSTVMAGVLHIKAEVIG